MSSQNTTFIQQIMSPGGGVLLIPFTRAVIFCLALTTTTVFILGVARIHMFILTFLSVGMWFALGIFEREFSKIMSRAEGIENGNDAEKEKKLAASKRAPPVSTAKRED